MANSRQRTSACLGQAFRTCASNGAWKQQIYRSLALNHSAGAFISPTLVSRKKLGDLLVFAPVEVSSANIVQLLQCKKFEMKVCRHRYFKLSKTYTQRESTFCTHNYEVVWYKKSFAGNWKSYVKKPSQPAKCISRLVTTHFPPFKYEENTPLARVAN